MSGESWSSTKEFILTTSFCVNTMSLAYFPRQLFPAGLKPPFSEGNPPPFLGTSLFLKQI